MPMTAIHTEMADGRRLCLRPLQSKDAPLVEAGIMALSERSRYLRFFSGFKQAPPSVLQRLTQFHGDDHLAWGAVDTSLETTPAIAAAHIIRVDELPDSRGDFAVAVLDDYHNQGVARAIIACLFSEAIGKGFETVELDVLSENWGGISLFRSLGAQTVRSEAGVKHMEIDLNAATAILKASQHSTLHESLSKFEERGCEGR